MICEEVSRLKESLSRAEVVQRRFPKLIFMALLLSTGCVSTRLHTVRQDSSDLDEVFGRIRDAEVSVHMVDGTVFDDVRIQSLAIDSTRFLSDTGLKTVSTKDIGRIEDEASRAGIVLGIVAGGAVGTYVSITSFLDAHGEDPAPSSMLLVGVPVGVIVGVVVSRVITVDDVYTLEEKEN